MLRRSDDGTRSVFRVVSAAFGAPGDGFLLQTVSAAAQLRELDVGGASDAVKTVRATDPPGPIGGGVLRPLASARAASPMSCFDTWYCASSCAKAIASS